MFDLENEIAQWRTGLTAACTTDDIDELETHLREQIEQLASTGLSTEEAFLVAARRLGDTDSLTREFTKINGGSILTRRLFWMIAGVLLYFLAVSVSSTVSSASVAFAGACGLRGASLAILGVTAKALSLILALLIVYILSQSRSAASELACFFASSTGKTVAVVLVVVVSIMLTLTQMAIPQYTISCLGVEEYGRLSVARHYAGWLWPILVPTALVVVLMTLKIPGRRDVRRV